MKRVDIRMLYREDSIPQRLTDTMPDVQQTVATTGEQLISGAEGCEESGREILNMASEQRTEPTSYGRMLTENRHRDHEMTVRLRQVPPVIAAGYSNSDSVYRMSICT